MNLAHPTSCRHHPPPPLGTATRTVRAWVIALMVALTAWSATAGSAGAGESGPPATPSVEGICATGRLNVGDIRGLADPWRITVEADRSLAIEWRPDAVLIATDLSCGFMLDEPRVRTSFYSADANGVWDPETADTQPLDPGAAEPKEIPSADVSFDVIHEALLGLGLEDGDEIGATGITIRLNTAEPPFGPRAIPAETVVVHLTVGSDGATRDIFVDAVTGQTYDYAEEIGHVRTGSN